MTDLTKGDPVRCDIMLGDDCETREYKMLQGDPALLKVLQAMGGEEVVVKGGGAGSGPGARESDGVVVCTGDKTFEMTVLETTNTCLLVRRCDDPVTKTVTGRIEETQVARRVPPQQMRAQLKRVLEAGEGEGESGGDADAADAKRVRYSTAELLPMLQGSRKEVEAELAAAEGVVQVGGVWHAARRSDVDDCYETFVRLAGVDLELDGFGEAEALAALGEYHGVVESKAVLKQFCGGVAVPAKEGEGEGGGGAGDGPVRLRVDLRAVALFRAGQLFLVNATWPLDKFMEEWAACCPPFVTPEEGMLLGFALVAKKSVQHFPSASLPLTAEARFEEMFKVLKRWDEAHLMCYVEPLVGPGVTREQLLAKYTREFPIHGKRTFVSFA